MGASKHFEGSLRKLIANTVGSRHPATVRDLAKIVLAESAFAEEDLIAVVKNMMRDGSLTLKDPRRQLESPLDYLLTPTLSAWLWTTLSVTAIALAAVFFTPNFLPVIIIRWLLGSLLVLFLPGYSFLQFLFPKGSEIKSLERFTLDIGLSLALVPLIGLVLNYTPWGIRFIPITASLSAFTIIFTIAAATRKYLHLREESAGF